MIKKRLLSFLGAAAITAALAFAVVTLSPSNGFTSGTMQEGLCYEATGVAPDAIVASVAGNGASADLIAYWIGYDMYLQLLEEAVLEQRGEKAPQRTECSADLTVSANLPESYIPSGEQRMDIYRRIAALRTPEESQELLDELIDRYGEPPQPVLKLMDVALLRAQAVSIGVCDITQRGSEIGFTFAASESVPVEAVMALCSLPKNRRRLTLSATGTEPKLTLRLAPNEDALESALTLVGDLRVNKEENEKER